MIHTIPDEIKAEIINNHGGIISPSGDIIMGLFMDGYKYPAFQKIAQFSKIIEKHEEKLQIESAEFSDGFPEDEHVEWHLFETYHDQQCNEFEKLFLKEAYSLGFSVFKVNSKYQSKNKVIHSIKLELLKTDFYDISIKTAQLIANSVNVPLTIKIFEEDQ